MNVRTTNRTELEAVCRYAYRLYGWESSSSYIYSSTAHTLSLTELKKKIFLPQRFPCFIHYDTKGIILYDLNKINGVSEMLSFEDFTDLFL